MRRHIQLERCVHTIMCISCTYMYAYVFSYRTEREKHAKHRHKSERVPAKYLSVIIDGMDQDKTDIPHIISKPKVMAGATTLETHVTGARAHGHFTVMAIDCGQYAHDSNLTIEILLRLFNELKVNIALMNNYQ